MSEWRKDLKRVLENMDDSKKLTSYNATRDLFSSVYSEIIQEAVNENTTHVEEEKASENKTFFYIHKYALCLVKTNFGIDVLAVDDITNIDKKIANIVFVDGYAKVNLAVTPTGDIESVHLNKHYVDQLFKSAYEPLLS